METLESVKKSEYDQDGNALRIESFDASDRKTSSDVYGYDEGGNWTSLIEEADGSVTNYLVFADPKTKRIAKVHSRSKDTEFITYTEQGFESATLTQTSTGRILEKTTIRRNSSQQEENVLFEEPPGTKTTEFQIQWSDRGFESRSVLVMHDKGGDQMVIQFEYPDVDAQGNWLTQIEKRVLMLKNGDKRTLPTVINKRTLSYHAEADKK